MPTIQAGKSVSILCPADGSITITPGEAGRVSLNARGRDGGQAIAPREIYSATTISFSAGDTLILEAINNSATYDQSLVSGDGYSGEPAAPFPELRNFDYTWIWRTDATSNSTMIGTWYFYVPAGSGYYNYYIFGNNFSYPLAADNWTMGRIGLAAMGAYTRHDAGTGVVKTGSWTTFTPAIGVFQQSQCRTAVAGDRVQFNNLVGHTLVHRIMAITNGGYCVVAVDGDWTRANRLPTFTEADLSAGRCRASDVGKRYMSFFYHQLVGDVHMVIADGLVDGPHTLTIEATGTKPAASSEARCYIGGIVAVGAQYAADTPSSTRAFAHIEPVFETIIGPAAWSVVFEAETAAANGTYEFRIGTHGGETVTSQAVFADGVDITSSAAAGSYTGCKMARFSVSSTLASSDATGTAWATKVQDFYMSGGGICPQVCETAITFSATKKIRAHYPLMMSIWGIKMNGANGVMETGKARWSDYKLGPWESDGSMPATVTVNTNYGNVAAPFAIATSAEHKHQAYAALLDGYESVRHFRRSYSKVFVQRKTTLDDKVYFERSSAQGIETFNSGDVARSVVGWGIRPGS
jgi:hypothetical protein